MFMILLKNLARKGLTVKGPGIDYTQGANLGLGDPAWTK